MTIETVKKVWSIINVGQKIREAFKKNNDETYGKFHILGGGQRGVIFHMLSRKILNAQKAILSIFRHLFLSLLLPKKDKIEWNTFWDNNIYLEYVLNINLNSKLNIYWHLEVLFVLSELNWTSIFTQSFIVSSPESCVE